MSYTKFEDGDQLSVIGGIFTTKVYGEDLCEKHPNQQVLFEEFKDYDQYLGIQEDPFGKTKEKYHVRMIEDYLGGDKSMVMVQNTIYFRVRDLAPVYKTIQTFITGKTFS